MRNHVYRIGALVVLLLSAVSGWPGDLAVSVNVPVFQKGYSYTPWSKSSMLQASSTQSIENMASLGVEWTALCVWWFQDRKDSTVITEDFNRYSASRESVAKAIEDFHANGIRVMLKPMVDIRTGEWRASIVPSAAWFEAYEAYCVDWAVFAAEHDVEMLSIGCEFQEATRLKEWEPAWRKIIAGVREVFHGPLTYAATFGEEQGIRWWDALDYIGIDAYNRLTTNPNATYEELVAAWKREADRIEFWRNRLWPGRPILFTEVGYRSVDGANTQPWEYSGGASDIVDLQEQVDCYRAAFEVLHQREWFWGWYWWNWETNPNAGGDNHTGYTIQNKPAQLLLKEWYKERLVGGRFEAVSKVSEYLNFRTP